ncbi:MAG: site-specific DNA-methyltransferase [Anaerolineales bacterium]|nr:site-specific DNA-methyltransferase [Anaerolineales bacterium]
MPSLHWDSKTESIPPGGKIKTDAILYPFGDDKAGQILENRLILGDNLPVMNALLPEFEGRIDLIYADPPFFTNKGYSARIGRGEDSRKPEDWVLAEGYPDEWSDMEAYLDMLYPRLKLMYKLLSDTGSFYLHMDWHANSYARLLLDEIFGYENLRNEIVWTYHGPSPIRSAYNRKHDTILYYSKSNQYTFNVDQVRIPYNENTVETFKSSKKAGFGKTPDLERGKVPEDWWYFPVVARLHSERTGYPTQKPERLMERIIVASSNPGDLVADFFGGAGTTATVACKLNRQFISSDTQARALHTTRSRIVINIMEDQQGKSDVLEQEFIIKIQRELAAAETQYSNLENIGIDPPEIINGDITLNPDLASQIIYWEIDPDWNGEIFHSKFQAARPWRKGEILTTAILPEKRGDICLRFVLIGGEQIQQVLLNK